MTSESTEELTVEIYGGTGGLVAMGRGGLLGRAKDERKPFSTISNLLNEPNESEVIVPTRTNDKCAIDSFR